jgi:hypothetical protein
MFCLKCGGEIPNESTFCFRCGATLGAITAINARPGEPQPATETRKQQKLSTTDPTPETTTEVSTRKPRTVTTTDSALEIYADRNLNSAVFARIPTGVEVELGETTLFEDREWIQARLKDRTAGYVLAPSARGHTTFGRALPPISEHPNLAGRVAPKQRETDPNAELWNCSNCNSPATEKVIASRRYFFGRVCNGCGRVLCEKCFKSLSSWICQCGGLFVDAPLNLRKKPLSQTAVDARAEGERSESVKTALGCLFITVLVALAFLGFAGIDKSGLTVTRAPRYVLITIGIIVATVGVRKKNNGLLFLGAAIIVTGRLFK